VAFGRQIASVVLLLFLVVAAILEPLLLWGYVGGGVILLAAVLVHRHQVSRLQYGRVLGFGRMRRFVRQVNVKGEKFWQQFWRLLPSTKVIVCFVAVSAVALLVGAVIGASVTNANIVRIRSVGTIRAVGVQVFADEELSTVLEEIAWGTLAPGDSRNFDCWVKNTGNAAQTLTLLTENWVPAVAQSSISLSWSYNNEVIQPGAAVPVTFTLSVDPGIAGVNSFSFDIIVQGVA